MVSLLFSLVAGMHEALLEAGTIRPRSFLMTTLAMVFGMMPLALGLGEGASQRAPMAHAVIGGLISSTLLTLLVVPVVYSLLDPLSEWFKRHFLRLADKPEPAAAAAVEAEAEGEGK